MKLKIIKPNFEHEWRDALRFREFEKMGKDEWINFVKDNYEVVDYDTIKDKLSNINLDFEKLSDEKRGHFHKHLKEGKMEMPMAVKFNENDFRLIGGNTRLAGLLGKKANPKIWVVLLEKYSSDVNEIEGGLADGLTLEDIAKKHDVPLKELKKQFKKGIKVEMEHTDKESEAEEITMDHLFEDPNYYDKLEKVEATEQTTSGSSGSFEAQAFGDQPIKKVDKIHNSPQSELDEVTSTATSAAGQYDAPFGTGSKDPLKIGGEKTIGARAKTIEKTKSFPKFGGPDGQFIKIKDKCKKFPYCNQGDINAIEPLREAIKEVADKHNMPLEKVEKLVLKEIRKIFI